MHSQKIRTGVLVRHGSLPARTSRARGAQSRDVQGELQSPMGVHGSNLSAQGCVQTAHPRGLGRTVHAENYETHASRSNVMLIMGPKALGTSDAGSQHPPGGVSDCRPTTTRVGDDASRASSIPGSARYSWRGLNANASGNRVGYSRGNETHMRTFDDQFQACVAEMKGTLISPRTPSWIDVNTGKGARLDHLVGLGVEFTCDSGTAAWVGSPFQDHARVSFAVKVGTLKPMANKAKDREWHQKITMKQWQGISHQIDDPLRVLAKQSLDRLQQRQPRKATDACSSHCGGETSHAERTG